MLSYFEGVGQTEHIGRRTVDESRISLLNATRRAQNS